MRQSNRISLDQLSVYDYERMAASFMCLFMGVESPKEKLKAAQQIEFISPQYVGRGSRVVIAMKVATEVSPKEIKRIDIRLGSLKVNTYEWDGRVLTTHVKIPAQTKAGPKDVRITFRRRKGECLEFSRESGIIIT